MFKHIAISTKIYFIVALLIAISAAIGGIGFYTLRAYSKATESIINSSERALLGEQINALVYSVVADSRGIYMSDDPVTAQKFTVPLLAALEGIKQKVAQQQKLLPAGRTKELDEMAAKVDEFVRFRTELVRLSQQATLPEARAYGDNDANRNNRKALNALIVARAADTAAEILVDQKAVNTLRVQARYAIAIAIAVGALAAALLGWAVANFGIIRPLGAIRQAMLQLAHGNLDVVIPGEDRRDEVGSMASAVAVFKRNAIEKVSMDEAAVREQKAKEARQMRVDALLGDFRTKASGVVSSVAAASTQLSLTAEHMSKIAQGTSQKSVQMAGDSGSTSQNVQSVASAAEEMSVTVREIAQQVHSSTTVVNEAVSKVTSADASAASLLKATETIGDITVLIESISQQINLLALNATIESARAGDAGKGFAVVASEVKNLAGQATRATEQIREQLSSVQSISSSVAGELQSVKLSVNKVSEFSTAIAAAVEEQAAATNEIVRNMQTAAQGVDSISRNAGDIRASADATTVSTGEVLEAAKLLSRQSEQLDSEVRGFLQDIQAA